MKHIINAGVVLSWSPAGPVASFLEPFAESLKARGYARQSVHRYVMLTACFSEWLKAHKTELCRIDSSCVAKYLKYRGKRVRVVPGDGAGLRHLLDFLRRNDTIPAETVSTPTVLPAVRCAMAYEHYLRETCALANATVINYVPFVRCFLKGRFGSSTVDLSRLRAYDVINFVQREAPLLHLKRAKLMTTAIRSFLRYARYSGEVTLDLAAAVPVVANWSMPSIPRAIAADQVRKLLTSIDRRTAIGRRDYAIVLLLARLGLRASEVAFLELDNINWQSGQIHVRGKRGQYNDLPLSKEVGKAIATYLQRGRPASTCRRVFLRAKAPNCGFQGASSIGTVVRRRILLAGVDAPTLGAHQFRHGLATAMLNKGSSLAEIGEVLGHRNPQTTKIYTKVDINGLRTLALPWPGGAQ